MPPGRLGDAIIVIGADSAAALQHLNAFRGQFLGQLQGIANQGQSLLRQAFAFGAGMMGAGAVVSGIQAMTGSVQQLTNTMVNSNAQFEQFGTSFKVLLGDAKQAAQMMRDIAQLAAKTPFEMPQLTMASQKLLAFGFQAKQIIPMLRTIGDVAAASPQGMAVGVERIVRAVGQMRAKGKIQAEEMLQLSEAGVPAWEMLAKGMGRNTAEVMAMGQKGQLSAEIAIPALLKGMEAKYGGMMQEQSQTYGGLTSTLKDNVFLALKDVGQPLFDWVKSLLKGMVELTSSPTAQRIGGVLREIMGDITEGLKGFVGGAGKLFATIDIVAILKAVGVGLKLLAGGLGMLMSALASMIEGIKSALRFLGINRLFGISDAQKDGKSPGEISAEREKAEARQIAKEAADYSKKMADASPFKPGMTSEEMLRAYNGGELSLQEKIDQARELSGQKPLGPGRVMRETTTAAGGAATISLAAKKAAEGAMASGALETEMDREKRINQAKSAEIGRLRAGFDPVRFTPVQQVIEGDLWRYVGQPGRDAADKQRFMGGGLEKDRYRAQFLERHSFLTSLAAKARTAAGLTDREIVEGMKPTMSSAEMAASGMNGPSLQRQYEEAQKLLQAVGAGKATAQIRDWKKEARGMAADLEHLSKYQQMVVELEIEGAGEKDVARLKEMANQMDRLAAAEKRRQQERGLRAQEMGPAGELRNQLEDFDNDMRQAVAAGGDAGAWQDQRNRTVWRAIKGMTEGIERPVEKWKEQITRISEMEGVANRDLPEEQRAEAARRFGLMRDQATKDMLSAVGVQRPAEELKKKLADIDAMAFKMTDREEKLARQTAMVDASQAERSMYQHAYGRYQFMGLADVNRQLQESLYVTDPAKEMVAKQEEANGLAKEANGLLKEIKEKDGKGAEAQ